MYKWFEARNFRCFKEIRLSSLERINLIAGMNNVGKTSILEALFIHAGAYNPALTMTINSLRGFERYKLEFGAFSETPWESLFRNYDPGEIIELIGDNSLVKKRVIKLRVVDKPEDLRKLRKLSKITSNDTVEITLESAEVSLESAKILELECREGGKVNKYYLIFHKKGIQTEPIPPSPPFPGFYQSDRVPIFSKDMAERFGKLEKYGKQDMVLKALQVIEPRLKRIAMIVIADQPILHGDIGLGRLVPISLMGGGIIRLANLILLIGNAENGVVLVDEIENGVHHSIMETVWQTIGEAARLFNTQVFATTHSWECIVSAHKAFSQNKQYNFRLYRLEQVDDTIHAVTYDRETLEAAIETGIEVR